jgi:hypothetical protein
MSQQPAPGASAPPEVIYIIRHGEKPADPPPADPGQPPPPPAPPFGVDYQGDQDEHSLLPRGWQRSGALAVLFDPALGELRAGLQVPTALLSPSYGDPGATTAHRTYQTIQGLSGRLGVPIVSGFAEGQEPELADSVVSTCSGVALICWEHEHIPALASSLPAVPGTVIPPQWPGDRFDVIWAFTLGPGPAPAQYGFGQIPQQLLSGDTATVIAPAGGLPGVPCSP